MTAHCANVTVLLATYNGARFLDEQIESIFRQDLPLIDVIVSDDGSTDRTIDILEEWQRRWTKGHFDITPGPRQGFSENFRSLVRRPTDTDFVAYSDQDDVWKSDKLTAAIASIERADPGPVLYCSRTELIDQHGAALGMSPLFSRPPGVRNAILQSIAGGNTMVMNRPAAEIVRESAKRTAFVAHDWWSYLIVTACGGAIIYDKVPRILYRQHEANLVGRNTGLMARIVRFKGLLQGRFSRWMDTNISGLKLCEDMLDDDARIILHEFEKLRELPGPVALRRLRALGLYRQTASADAGLWVATLMGKL